MSTLYEDTIKSNTKHDGPSRAQHVSAALDTRKEEVLVYLLPNGRKVGHEFHAGSLAGEAGNSLKVDLNGKGGVWCDFATGDKGADLLDLWAQARCGGDIRKAMQEAAAWLALSKRERSARPLGTATASWTYHHPNGDPCYEVRRYDFVDGKKEFRPYNPTTGEWKFPTPRLIYNAHELTNPELAHTPVHCFEGEKCCEAAKSKGLPLCITTAGGASSPHCSDFSPLHGRDVFIFPDNDDAGQRYGESVAKLCLKVEARPYLCPIPENKPIGWDIADAVAEGWTLDEIENLRAQAKPYEASIHNGAAHAFDMGEDDAEETEEEENDRVMKEERPIEDKWPCPSLLWRGPFALVAKAMGKQTWEVWVAVLVALGAKAHRNIAYKYHRMLYGMVYALLIKGTGMGKGLSTDLCRGLMPDWYVIRDAVQSGPALAPLLAEITRGKQGKIESCTSHPALLLIEEFTGLLKNAGIQHSTLIDSLNSLFHRPWSWNISRSERPNSGGGDVVIKDPTLSLLVTTTEALFKEYVSPQMIRGGFLNRFLVLPGDTTPWKFYDPEGAGNIIHQDLGLFDHIPMRKVGDGQTVWQAYEPPAFDRLKSWGEQTFEPIMQSSELEAESVKRLHVYAHVIGLLYAWGDQRELVNLEDVECSIVVIETSQRFLQALIAEEQEPEIPKFKAYEMNLEQRILAKVTEAAERGIRRRNIIHALHRHATTPDLYAFITKMEQVGTIREVAEMTDGAKKPVHKLYLPEHNPEREKAAEK